MIRKFLAPLLVAELFEINGIPIQQCDLKNKFGAVMQDDQLFSGSILENITLFENASNIDQIYKVAKIAEIHDDIMQMPMKYETLIGDITVMLSGGQRQRILLARALYKNPEVLFLDEATSHLDLETEEKINHSLKKLNIMSIVISHKPQILKMADRIYQLKEKKLLFQNTEIDRHLAINFPVP